MVELFASVVAHHGGWNQALFVLTPLVIFAFLLHIGRTRAERAAAGLDADDERLGADDAGAVDPDHPGRR